MTGNHIFILPHQDPSTEQYVYNHSDARPWDENNDLYAYESDFVIRTKTKHKTPMVRTQSIVSVSDEAVAVKPADPAGVSGLVTNSITFCCLFTIKDWCKKCVFNKRTIKVCVSCR